MAKQDNPGVASSGVRRQVTRPDMPSFRARAPWWGGHLQTLRNHLVRPAIALAGRHQRLYFAMDDGSGDRLATVLDTPDEPADGPLMVLIHGLSGHEDSYYMRLSAAFHLKRRREVLRFNLRGAGPSRTTCAGQYHSGCAPDIRKALLALDDDLMSRGLFLVGYSLGGNILLHLLATHAQALPIVGAAAISAPIEPAVATRRIMMRRNAIYHHWLLREIKRECCAEGARLTDDERRAVSDVQTLYELDDKFTAPRNGFADADDYYTRTAGGRVASHIRVPTMLIHARDDPWIPAEPYDALEATLPPNVKILLTDGGGHVGFHAQGYDETWHDRCVDRFLKTLREQDG